MSKKVLSTTGEILVTVLFSALLLALPFIVYPIEMGHVIKFSIVKIACYGALPLCIVALIACYMLREDPNKDWLRVAAIILALFVAIASMAPASDYRQDAKANIQFDRVK